VAYPVLPFFPRYSGKKVSNIKCVIELFVPTNALRQFFHCFLYYYNAPIRILAVILPSSGGILSEFLHRPILWLRHNSESVFVTNLLPKCVLGHRNNKENSEKTVLVHLLVQIIQL
jgi:hypothetical protein